MSTLTVHKTIRKRHSSVSFANIANTILPKNYDLSLVLIGDTLGRKLNKEHKNRDYPTNVLSFPLEKLSGEIFINVRRAERDADKFGHSKAKHLAYLFIHGCLHLAGYDHGSIMDKLELKYLKKFTK